MNWNWNATSEVLGFASALAFFIPSWKANSVMREVSTLRQLAAQATNDFSKDAAKELLAHFAANPLTWSRLDDACLKFGAGLLAISFAIKFVIAL